MTMDRSARYANVLLGSWLLLSAFLWPHSPEQFTNTVVVGFLCAVLALLAAAVPPVRFVNVGLTGWLFVSAFVLPTYRTATVWHNAIAALLMLVVALTGKSVSPPRRRATGAGVLP